MFLINNLTKDYICKYNFVKEKIKEKDYDSSEEDELFTKLKSFNDKYKQYIGSSITFWILAVQFLIVFLLIK